ncbi:VOC family protein [Streptomyces sudanensis]|uniref:VOC family protein n=1 Tax=Streptomyces sudanensis TaxID=436397 RepID=UPI0020CC233E|nr:VOC family protein [Streptomyces sudanensis]MCP9959855.1 VOC family protein [Streptomyces sudanensis]MCP9999739.1 VOC family protein [Streptomyces sudanensis]
MRATVSEIVFDCADPAALARFWAGLLGGDPVDRDPDWSYVDPPGFVRVAFQRVPEGRAAKNRLHLDLSGGDVESAAERAVALGAVRVGGLVRDAYGGFRVMRDPEGNEFCFVSG